MEIKYGATIEGTGRVFAHNNGTWTSYSFGISSKDKDGNWINGYQPIRFKKGVDVPNKAVITYKAFPTAVQGKERPMVIWQILEYSVAEEYVPTEPSGFSALTNEDVPF